MQFRSSFAEGVQAGVITASVRRWSRPRVRAGGRYRRPNIGLTLVVESVAEINEAEVDASIARAAGFATPAELFSFLDSAAVVGGAATGLYLVRFHAEPLGDVPRPPPLTAGEAERRLDAMDSRSSIGPWTRAVLQLISADPGRRAADLAALCGLETVRFKANARKLKRLGLIISLKTGYELTDLGRALVRP